ncbi:MAG: hypothetical protein QXS93_00030 [Candidatus Micrarchaeia archaeon]
MALYGRDDDYLQLIAILFIGFLALLFITQVCGKTTQGACPDGYYECASSPCGCCKQNTDGSVDVCSGCADYVVVGGKCCKKSNLDDCISSYDVCVFPESCVSDADCSAKSCPKSVCEVQPDGKNKCKPCEKGAVCNPSLKNSCCADMMCDPKTSRCQPCIDKECLTNDDCCNGYSCNPQPDNTRKCEPCLDQPCDTRPCCPGYECSVQPGGSKLCKPCEGVLCTSDKDCCNNYGCFNGKCASCVAKPCTKNSDCCNGYSCTLQRDGTRKCQPCISGLDCTGQQCCPGMQCTPYPDGSNKCIPCIGKTCTSSSDCCKGDFCVGGVCTSLSSCVGVGCTTPGEPCRLCSNVQDLSSCSKCTDNTICANDGTGKFVCQPACQDGGVACDTCPTGCCDPLTNECICGPGEHPCEGIEGCSCCVYGSQVVTTCPEGTFLCPGYGCKEPFLCSVDPITRQISCTFPSFECPSGTFECTQQKGSCCAYVIPANAIPPSISTVDTSICGSGYGVFVNVNIGSISLNKYICCDKITYTLTGSMYTYSFICGGKSYTGTSTVSPYEYVVSAKQVLGEDFCKEAVKRCTESGVDVDKCFKQPISVNVGG